MQQYESTSLLRSVVFLLVFTLSINVLAFSCGKHSELVGVTDKDDVLLCKKTFLVAYDKFERTPSWVSYYLTKDSVQLYYPRNGIPFKADSSIDGRYSASLNNYRHSGFDRGHYAPAAAIDIDKSSQQRAALLTNIGPQIPDLNRKGMKAAESLMRDYANKYSSIYVVSGGFSGFNLTNLPQALKETKAYQSGRLIENQHGFLALDGIVQVSSWFYKAYFIPRTGKTGVFLFPHAKVEEKDIFDYHFSIADAEKLIGRPLFAPHD